MTDFVITAGRSSYYPKPEEVFGSQVVGTRATFCLAQDFANLDANTLAIPGLPIISHSNSPVQVSNKFFGLTITNRLYDNVSGTTFGTVRSHDIANGKGRWQFIQPVSGTWDFAELDYWVNTHYAAGRDLVFTFFGTPSWASARNTERNAYSDNGTGQQFNRGIAAEPTNMANWDAYCTAIATRYKGKIGFYEVWNEPNYNNDGTGPGANTDCFFTGTWAKLAEMTRRANQAVKAIDPAAKIICPPVQGWATTSNTSNTYFTGMLAASSGDVGNTPMSNWVDIVGVHLYLNGTNLVQNLYLQIAQVRAAMSSAGVSSLDLWDTESAPIGSGNQIADLTDARAITLMYRTNLILAAKGVVRTIFYTYDIAGMGFSNRPAIISAREDLIRLLTSGKVLTVAGFTDGRVGYWSSLGLILI